jgi:hypothetical protein
MRDALKWLLVVALLVGFVWGGIWLRRRWIGPLQRPPENPSTQLLLKSVGEADREVIRALFLVSNLTTGRQATGVLTQEGPILTGASVVAGARPGDIRVTSSLGVPVPIRGMQVDPAMGVAQLYLHEKLKGGMDLSGTETVSPGEAVYAWGFPEGVEPPEPLISSGTVAGLRVVKRGGGLEPRLVLSGAFTFGYGGGPLFRTRDFKVVGLVVTRPLRINPAVERAIQALRARAAQEDPARAAADDALQSALEGLGQAQAGVVAEAVPLSELKALLDRD